MNNGLNPQDAHALRDLIESLSVDPSLRMEFSEEARAPERLRSMDVTALASFLCGLPARFKKEGDPVVQLDQAYYYLKFGIDEREGTDIGGITVSTYKARSDSEWDFLIRLLTASEIAVKRTIDKDSSSSRSAHYLGCMCAFASAIVQEVDLEECLRNDPKISRQLKNAFMPLVDHVWTNLESGRSTFEYGAMALSLFFSLRNAECGRVVKDGHFTDRTPDKEFCDYANRFLSRVVTHLASAEYSRGWALASAWVKRIIGSPTDRHFRPEHRFDLLRERFTKLRLGGESEYYACFDRDYFQHDL